MLPPSGLLRSFSCPPSSAHMRVFGQRPRARHVHAGRVRVGHVQRSEPRAPQHRGGQVLWWVADSLTLQLSSPEGQRTQALGSGRRQLDSGLPLRWAAFVHREGVPLSFPARLPPADTGPGFQCSGPCP